MLTYTIISTVLCVGGWSAFGVYFWKNQGHKKFVAWGRNISQDFNDLVDRWQGQK